MPKKRKAYYLNLSESVEKHQVGVDGKRIQAELSRILQLNQSLHPVTRDVLESVQSILPLVEDQAPALQASKLSLLECTRLLGIDFELDEAHRWILKEKRP